MSSVNFSKFIINIIVLFKLLIVQELICQVLEAESMAVKTSGVLIPGGWSLSTNGYLANQVDFSGNEYYSFEVIARGSYASNEWPFMEVQIDNLVGGPIVVDDPEWKSYTISSQVLAGNHVLSLAYINGQGSRRLDLDRVTITTAFLDDEDWLIRLSDSILSKNPHPENFSITDWQLEELMWGVAKAYEITGDARYLDFVRSRMENHVDENGNLDIEISDIIPGIMLIWLYQMTGENKYLLAATQVAEYMLNEYPRTAEGGFVHLPYLLDQLWVDTLGGVGRFFGLMGHITGDVRYFNEGTNQILIHALRLQDAVKGLFYHGWDEDGSASWATAPKNCSPCFWARGNGWVVRGLADLLEYLPTDHPQRSAVVLIFQNLVSGLAQCQDVPSGLWYTVLDRGGDAGNYLETSGSTLLAYGIQKGINLGCISNSFQTNVDLANAGLYRKVYLKAGTEAIVTGISAATGPGDYNNYITKPIRTGDDYPYGDGVLLQEKAVRASSANLMTYKISGYALYYAHDYPIQNVDVNISHGQVGHTITNAAGYYEYINLAQAAAYDLAASKPAGSAIGSFAITTYDAALTAQAAVGLKTLAEYEAVAADVNKDGWIYMFDAALTAQYSVGLPKQPFSYVGEWKFEPESYHHENLNSNKESQNFTGILLGDVDGGWTPEEVKISKGLEINQNRILSDVVAMPGDTIDIPLEITTEAEVIAVEIDFSYKADDLKFIEIERTAWSRLVEIIFNDEPGRLRIAAYTVSPIKPRGAFLNLKFKVIRQEQGASELSFDKFNVNNDIFFKAKAQLIINKKIAAPIQFNLYQNFPNPFSLAGGNNISHEGKTVIFYELPEQEQVSLKIYNYLGQEVRTLMRAGKPPGSHQVFWDGTDNIGNPVLPGIYFYRIEAGNFKKTKRLIVLR